MSLTIYKYKLEIRDVAEVALPPSAKVLSVGEQDGNLYLWAEVDTKEHNLSSKLFYEGKSGSSFTVRRFRIAGTGHPLDVGMKLGRFIGTVHMPYRLEPNDEFSPVSSKRVMVWHVYEEGE